MEGEAGHDGGRLGPHAVRRSSSTTTRRPSPTATCRELTTPEGVDFALVASPVQFDQVSPTLRPAPEHGQHTEEILLERGMDWERMAALKEDGSIL